MRTAARAAGGIVLLAVAIGLAPTPAAALGEGRVEQQQIAALQQMVATVNAGDAAGYARLYSPDALVTIHGSDSIRGRDAIERYEAGLMREFPGARLAFFSAWQAPPLAVVHYGVNGRTADGRAMGHEGVLFFLFDASGAIKDERRYLDSLTPMAQMGALGPAPARPLPALPWDVVAYVASNSAQERRNVALVKRALTAIEAKDAASFFGQVTANVTIDEVMLPEPFAGRPNAGRWFEMWSHAVRDPRLELTKVVGVGTFVLAETIIRGTLAAPFGRLAASARPFSVHRAMVVEIDNGAIARLIGFMNGKELAEATGQWPLRP